MIKNCEGPSENWQSGNCVGNNGDKGEFKCYSASGSLEIIPGRYHVASTNDAVRGSHTNRPMVMDVLLYLSSRMLIRGGPFVRIDQLHGLEAGSPLAPKF